MSVQANRLVQSLPATIPFVAPEETERQTGQVFKARLGANEGNFGASPAAIAAMAAAARHDVWKYSDPSGHDLRAAIAAKNGLSLAQVQLGAGIDGLLGQTVRLFSDVGDTIVTSLGAYPTFNYHVAAYGRQLVTVPYVGGFEDLNALAQAAADHKAAIVYVSNPDNPMGSWWPGQAIADFAHSLAADTLLILDEAYGETAPAGTLPDHAALPANVLRMRTFSKAYGLAGLRCGYVLGDASLVGAFDKIRDHFGVNVMAQKAALAALGDEQWLAGTLEQITASKARIAAIAADNHLLAHASATNFVTLDTGKGAPWANALVAALMERQVFVRKPMAPGLDHCIRVSVGRAEELDWFEQQLPAAIKAIE